MRLTRKDEIDVPDYPQPFNLLNCPCQATTSASSLQSLQEAPTAGVTAAQEDLLQEASVMAQVAHPNLVALIGVITRKARKTKR